MGTRRGKGARRDRRVVRRGGWVWTQRRGARVCSRHANAHNAHTGDSEARSLALATRIDGRLGLRARRRRRRWRMRGGSGRPARRPRRPRRARRFAWCARSRRPRGGATVAALTAHGGPCLLTAPRFRLDAREGTRVGLHLFDVARLREGRPRSHAVAILVVLLERDARAARVARAVVVRAGHARRGWQRLADPYAWLVTRPSLNLAACTCRFRRWRWRDGSQLRHELARPHGVGLGPSAKGLAHPRALVGSGAGRRCHRLPNPKVCRVVCTQGVARTLGQADGHGGETELHILDVRACERDKCDLWTSGAQPARGGERSRRSLRRVPAPEVRSRTRKLHVTDLSTGTDPHRHTPGTHKLHVTDSAPGGTRGTQRPGWA